jgi:16S rRNA pseudouridine516 synthase
MPRKDLHIVGRLDRDTTGLLLLTNDIKLRKRLTLPLYHIEKTYQFTCLHPLTKEEVDKANEGVVIDDNHLCECFIQMKDEKEGYITIHEGRYHEVKKIFLSLNNKILSLKRISFGHLELGHLQEGEYRHLSDDEIATLRESVYLD